MKKPTARIVLIILILALAAMSCIGGGGGDKGGVNGSASNTNGGSSQIQATMAADATATFGAEQFHLQLTAIAGEEK